MESTLAHDERIENFVKAVANFDLSLSTLLSGIG